MKLRTDEERAIYFEKRCHELIAENAQLKDVVEEAKKFIEKYKMFCTLFCNLKSEATTYNLGTVDVCFHLKEALDRLKNK